MTNQIDQGPVKHSLNRSRGARTLGRLSQTEAEALLNDLQEAQAIAAEYQRKLALKSNDLALLKQTLERAVTDLGLLRTTVAELRAERHRLAGEVMKLEWVKDKVVVLAKRVIQLEQGQATRSISDAGPKEGGMIDISYDSSHPEVMVFATPATHRRARY